MAGIDEMLRGLSRSALRRALRGEHRVWYLVAGCAYLLRHAHERDDRVARIRLRPGERYVVEVRGEGADVGVRGRSGGLGLGGRSRHGRRERGSGPTQIVWEGDRIAVAGDPTQ